MKALEYHSTIARNLHESAITKPPIFIVGAPRSGTTLLRHMLNRHPALSICGETHYFRYVYAHRWAFGDLSNPRNRSRLVKEYLSIGRIKRLGVDVSKLAENLLREATSYPAFFACVLRFYAESMGKQRCGEKTPQHALFTETLSKWWPGAAILHLLRDPRDVVASLQRMPWASNSVVTNARVWLKCTLGARRSSHRPRYLLVRYETLAAQPEKELARICSHLGEEYSPSMLIPNEESIVYSSISSRSRLPLTTERIGKWQEELSKSEVALIEWVAGKHMETFEYHRTTDRPSGLAIARGLGFAAYDAVAQRMTRLPASLYYLVRRTKLPKEEFWVSRSIRKQERA